MSRRSPDRRLAILSFHKIGEPPPGGWETWFYIPETTFARYLTYLKESGWAVIDLATLLRRLATPERLPERSALLTFDDGYRSARQVALPWLRRFGYPAVLFVPTDYVGGRNRFDAGNEPDESLCDWDDLRELQRSGVEIESHGASHRAFSKLAPGEREAELARSKAELEAGLRKPVQAFAYPYGDAGPDRSEMRRALARAGYRAAFLYGGRPHRLPVADVFHLERVAMGPDTDLETELTRGSDAR